MVMIQLPGTALGTSTWLKLACTCVVQAVSLTVLVEPALIKYFHRLYNVKLSNYIQCTLLS